MRHSIFISYRRDDSEGEAGRLYDDLVRVYGKNAVFMDVAGIAPGLDFRKAIDDNVAGCGVFLALLGPQWANITGSDGKRRLDDPVDFVRLEVASALARNIAVIPVLVHEARMPHPDQLPDNIKDLAYRNSVEISHARWDSDVNLLVDALKQYVTTSPATETQPVHAAVPVQLPPPVSTDPSSAPSAAKSRTTLIVAGIAVVLFLGVIAYFIAGRKPEPGRVATSSSGASGTGQTIILEGAWRNTSPVGNADSLIMLRISGSGPTYNVQPVGQCPQGQCPWATHPLVLQDGRGTSQWKPRFTPRDTNENRVVDITIEPAGENLRVTVRNTFSPDPNSSPRTSDFQYTFERQQP
ncbi:MAG: toll/interleukin-1 receptor domain-containing protein [Silvibacterium sp.]|nr:toll/interleukin-1 receptor domain-containing protein [Silvibacterium sp.]MBV8436224.1 toll/interleukin-1 receptor domain-containing protein [Silvibacterium sp.]